MNPLKKKLSSFAKINIGLKIIRKREDGYHDIETIFYPVSLYDTIEISIEPSSNDSNSVIIHCNEKFLPVDKKNICYKAIESFFVAFKIREHFIIKIDITKRIPVGGGLGGGSSNAASIIKFLVRYFNVNINEHRKEILQIALQCGSDVPFFLIGKPCFASGRGENMRILPNFEIVEEILLVNPNLHVSTRAAFEKLGLKEGIVRASDLSLQNSFAASNKEIFQNDFEDVVFPEYPILSNIKQMFYSKGASFASLSGSGGTMYGFFKKHHMAAEVMDRFEAEGYFTYLNRASA